MFNDSYNQSMYLLRGKSFRIFLVMLLLPWFLVLGERAAFSDLFVSSSTLQDLKQSLFGKIEDLFEQAKTEQADLLSPTQYAKAQNKFEEAVRDYDKGKSLKDIKKKLAETQELLRSAIGNARQAKISLQFLLKAREDALKANAPQYTLELYNQGEKLFAESVKKIEDGDIDKATEKGKEAEQKFREAELNAIKLSIIGNVRTLLEQAKAMEADRYAPRTFSNAVYLLNKAEEILNSDRSAKTEAREMAEEAEYQARHAMYLVKLIKKLKTDEKNWEKMILEHEGQVAKVINELGFEPSFDQGTQQPVESALLAIKNLKEENRRLSQELDEQNKQIEKLSAELSAVQEKQAGLQAKLEKEKLKKEKFKKVESIFSQEEAKVFREGDKLIIRLHGLNFPVGKAVINPEYFSLLTKLQRSIHVFPDYHITIEGHTDSKGDDRYNERLSQERAEAVRQYLLANMMTLSEGQISAVGYGESKPIASNDTEAGRAQNRRIDIIMTPPK